MGMGGHRRFPPPPPFGGGPGSASGEEGVNPGGPMGATNNFSYIN
jgi:hypothetical protein